MVEASKEALLLATIECDVVSPTEGQTNSNYEIARGSGVTRCKVHSHTRTESGTRFQRSKGSHGKFLVTKNISSEKHFQCGRSHHDVENLVSTASFLAGLDLKPSLSSEMTVAPHHSTIGTEVVTGP